MTDRRAPARDRATHKARDEDDRDEGDDIVQGRGDRGEARMERVGGDHEGVERRQDQREDGEEEGRAGGEAREQIVGDATEQIGEQRDGGDAHRRQFGEAIAGERLHDQ
ncbi:MAG: hypothetical protein AVDCRST_MAG18-2337 [uncultured Thermomicrobiales bacterium]|uniref:Uncharacterized protein n=1 Tax=uncultured Thermomicrobiales bacterium TaxID=1645740 RepID=A0A6J4VCZ3_9BACT|nr:MAG: hypothetical protein AVDCRST_MAG18-2337 [uncultured Thermomicrobiales bacterium]